MRNDDDDVGARIVPTAQPAGVVATVTGSLRSADLGPMLPAEHLLAVMRPPAAPAPGSGAEGCRLSNGPELPGPLTMAMLGAVSLGADNADDRMLDTAAVRGDLTAWTGLGGGAVVEITSVRDGRDPRGLRTLA